MGTKVTKNTRVLDSIIRNMAVRGDEVLEDITNDAKRQTRRTIVAMRVFDNFHLHDSIDGKRVKRGVWRLEDGVLYGIFQHEGYHDRGGNYHKGRPFMRSPFVENRQKWLLWFKRVFEP